MQGRILTDKDVTSTGNGPGGSDRQKRPRTSPEDATVLCRLRLLEERELDRARHVLHDALPASIDEEVISVEHPSGEGTRRVEEARFTQSVGGLSSTKRELTVSGGKDAVRPGPRPPGLPSADSREGVVAKNGVARESAARRSRAGGEHGESINAACTRRTERDIGAGDHSPSGGSRADARVEECAEDV